MASTTKDSANTKDTGSKKRCTINVLLVVGILVVGLNRVSAVSELIAFAGAAIWLCALIAGLVHAAKEEMDGVVMAFVAVAATVVLIGLVQIAWLSALGLAQRSTVEQIVAYLVLGFGGLFWLVLLIKGAMDSSQGAMPEKFGPITSAALQFLALPLAAPVGLSQAEPGLLFVMGATVILWALLFPIEHSAATKYLPAEAKWVVVVTYSSLALITVQPWWEIST